MEKILISILVQIARDQDRELVGDHGNLCRALEKWILGQTDVPKQSSWRVRNMPQDVFGTISIDISEYDGAERLIYSRSLIQSSSHGAKWTDLVPSSRTI
ncbi:MAG: hypothetical protein JNM84_28200 [Planctomycetes bacterium]|nr:hypothetical protein [Planctomycetota bacterium]